MQQRSVAFQMEIIITELVIDHYQPFCVVRKTVLPGHTNAAVGLDTFLGDELAAATNNVFGGSQGAATLIILRGIRHAGGEDGHGPGLLQLRHHVNHTVLEYLELANGHTELPALFQVIEGLLTGHLHHSDRFGTKSRNGPASLVFDNRGCLSDFSEQRLGADLNVI